MEEEGIKLIKILGWSIFVVALMFFEINLLSFVLFWDNTKISLLSRSLWIMIWSLFYIALAIGLLHLKTWGRIGIVVLGILFLAFGINFHIDFLPYLFHGLSHTPKLLSLTVVLACGFVLLQLLIFIVLPIFIVIYLTRPKVIAQFK